MNVNLKKYGFVRDEKGDFSDDGARFYHYVYEKDHRVTATKCTDKEYVYVDIKFQAYPSLAYKYFSECNGIRKELFEETMPKVIMEVDEFLAKENGSWNGHIQVSKEQIDSYVSNNDYYTDESFSASLGCEVERVRSEYDLKHAIEDMINNKHRASEEVLNNLSLSIANKLMNQLYVGRHKYEILYGDLTNEEISGLVDDVANEYSPYAFPSNLGSLDRSIAMNNAKNRIKSFYFA